MVDFRELTATQLQGMFQREGIGINGFDYSWRRTKEWQPWSDDIAEQVRVAVARLSLCEKTKTVNRRVGSYTLKHECEAWAGRYVSNGALLMAAWLLGFKIKQIAHGPNGWLNISNKGRPCRETL